MAQAKLEGLKGEPIPWGGGGLSRPTHCLHGVDAEGCLVVHSLHLASQGLTHQPTEKA